MKNTLAHILSKILLLTFVLGGFCISMSGCMSIDSDKSLLDPGDPVTLTVWHVYGEQADAPMNLLIEEFNETVGHDKGIRIQVTNVTSTSKILAQLLDAQASRELRNCPTSFPVIHSMCRRSASKICLTGVSGFRTRSWMLMCRSLLTAAGSMKSSSSFPCLNPLTHSLSTVHSLHAFPQIQA